MARKKRRAPGFDAQAGRALARDTGNRFRLIPLSRIAQRAEWAAGKSSSVGRGMRSGAVFPAIRVGATARGYDIMDGIHRVAQARRAGFTHIAAVVEGSQREAGGGTRSG